MFKVQKNVAMPATVRNPATVKRVYPYHTMDVGDFFFVPNKKKNTLSSHASAAGRKLGRKFNTRLTHAYLDKKENWHICEASREGAVLGIGAWRSE
jgi:hypothetical protein